MKKLIASMAVSILSVLAAHSAAPPAAPLDVATFKLSAITQGQFLYQVKTNTSATVTNKTTTLKAAVDIHRFSSSNLLALIENSFNTNFDRGAQIGMIITNGNLFVVVLDSSGTNILFTPPTSVISSGYNINQDAVPLGTNFYVVGIVSWRNTEVTTQNSNGTSESGVGHDTDYLGYLLTYDDTSLTPTDGKHSQFQFNGLMVESVISNLKTDTEKVSEDIQGTGGGLVDGVETLFTGTITLK